MTDEHLVKKISGIIYGCSYPNQPFLEKLDNWLTEHCYEGAKIKRPRAKNFLIKLLTKHGFSSEQINLFRELLCECSVALQYRKLNLNHRAVPDIAKKYMKIEKKSFLIYEFYFPIDYSFVYEPVQTNYKNVLANFWKQHKTLFERKLRKSNFLVDKYSKKCYYNSIEKI